MKIQSIIIVIVIMVLNTSSNLYSQWISLGNLPINTSAVRFVNENTGWVVGSGGNIFKTTNSGLNWTSQTSGITSNLLSAAFINENTGWAVINDGTVIKTTNAGINWINISGPITMQYAYDICFLNANTGYMLTLAAQNNSTDVRKSVDGGFSWSSKGGGMLSPVKFFFLNENTGWIITSGYNTTMLNTTTNGGTNWNYLSNIKIHRIFFVNENTGFAAGINGLLFKSTNGGTNWDTLSSGTTNSITGIIFPDNYTGYVIGSSGTILKTSNSGLNWISQSGAGTTNLNSICFINQNTGWIAGEGGLILKTSNGGVVSISKNENQIPEEFSLGQNYPNPFNPVTKIQFQVPSSKFIKLIVCDILGREVAVLVNEKLQPGAYEINFDAKDLPSGIVMLQGKSDKLLF